MKKNIIFVLILSLLFSISISVTACAAVVTLFQDMNNHWAGEVINELVEKGVIGGYPDKTFKPDNPITRAEFSKILRYSLDLEKVEGNSFEDTINHWAKNDINTLVQNNIIKQEEYKNKYDPDKKINRLEIAKMLVRALDLDEEAISRAGENTGFNDENSIEASDKGYIIIANEKGIINGYPDKTFKPNSNATRAEASSMIVRTLNVLQDKIIEIPRENGVVMVEKLPKKTFEEVKINNSVKEEIEANSPRFNLKYSPGKIVEVEENFFPLEYEDIIIKDFKQIPYEKSFIAGTNSYYWGRGMALDLLIFEAEVKQKKVVDGFKIFLLDENNNKVKEREITVARIQPDAKNGEVEQKALKLYPNLPQFDASKGLTEKTGKLTLMFTVPSGDMDKTKTILFYNEDLDKEQTDIVKFPVK